MRPTEFLRALGLVLLGLLFGCTPDPAMGPVEIHWDRDACAHCQMAIGDRRYAAQIRLEEGRPADSFDDLGCAVAWLDEAAAAYPSAGLTIETVAEFWVRDAGGDDWRDARRTQFTSGHRTPMGYGFAAGDAVEGLALEEVTERVRAIAARRRPGGGG
jgi:hypothetical protein